MSVVKTRSTKLRSTTSEFALEVWDFRRTLQRHILGQRDFRRHRVNDGNDLGLHGLVAISVLRENVTVNFQKGRTRSGQGVCGKGPRRHRVAIVQQLDLEFGPECVVKRFDFHNLREVEQDGGRKRVYDAEGLKVLFEDPTFHGERHVSEGDGGEVALILFFVDIAEHGEFLARACNRTD